MIRRLFSPRGLHMLAVKTATIPRLPGCGVDIAWAVDQAHPGLMAVAAFTPINGRYRETLYMTADFDSPHPVMDQGLAEVLQDYQGEDDPDASVQPLSLKRMVANHGELTLLFDDQDNEHPEKLWMARVRYVQRDERKVLGFADSVEDRVEEKCFNALPKAHPIRSIKLVNTRFNRLSGFMEDNPNLANSCIWCLQGDKYQIVYTYHHLESSFIISAKNCKSKVSLARKFLTAALSLDENSMFTDNYQKGIFTNMPPISLVKLIGGDKKNIISMTTAALFREKQLVKKRKDTQDHPTFRKQLDDPSALRDQFLSAGKHEGNRYFRAFEALGHERPLL